MCNNETESYWNCNKYFMQIFVLSEMREKAKKAQESKQTNEKLRCIFRKIFVPFRIRCYVIACFVLCAFDQNEYGSPFVLFYDGKVHFIATEMYKLFASSLYSVATAIFLLLFRFHFPFFRFFFRSCWDTMRAKNKYVDIGRRSYTVPVVQLAQ